jgi:hypothetical protein
MSSGRTLAAELHFDASGMAASGMDNQPYYLSGQLSQFYVVVMGDESATYRLLPKVGPEGLTFEAGTQDESGFHVNPAWTVMLQPQHYVDADRQRADSLYRSGAAPAGRGIVGEFYQYFFTVPDLGEASRLCVRATFEHDKYGTLESEAVCLPVVKPRSFQDTQIIWTSFIDAAFLRGDTTRMLALADSFIAQGYSYPEGLINAVTAARGGGDYTRALGYLDLNYRVNGLVQRSQIQLWHGTRLPDTDSRRQLYRDMRQDFVRLSAPH